jgi:hypothetical protein
MSSQVQICNMALGYLNHGIRIAALDEGSNESDQCQLYYDHALRSALRAAPWAFAKRYASLANLSNPVLTEWAFMYAYPIDGIIIRAILPRVASTPPNRWEIASTTSNQKVILCSVPDAVACYTASITDPSLFDPQFVSAFAWQLAGELAIVLTGNPGLKQMADAQFGRAVNLAMVSNGAEEVGPPAIEAEWIRAREDAPYARGVWE